MLIYYSHADIPDKSLTWVAHTRRHHVKMLLHKVRHHVKMLLHEVRHVKM